MSKFILQNLSVHDVVFVCIGTDRSTGDALGPMVGTMLEERGYKNVIGTLDNPCHAMNLHERLELIPKGKKIIAIDSALGTVSNIGIVNFRNRGLKPGAGVNKDLGVVGDYSINAVVNVGGFMEYFVLQNTRLSVVIKLAKEIVLGITSMIPKQLEVAATLEDDIA